MCFGGLADGNGLRRPTTMNEFFTPPPVERQIDRLSELAVCLSDFQAESDSESELECELSESESSGIESSQ